MKENIRSRNIGINSYVAIFIVTLVGSFATLFIVHVATDMPFKAFASADVYEIN